jgi:acetyl esterase/lipase
MSPSEPQPVSFALWPKLAPGTEHWSHTEQETTVPFGRITFVRNVTQPTLTAYLPGPDVATGAAVIICPGGGFYFHSLANEGTEVAQWFAARGVAAFVLKYRLIPTPASDQDFLQLVPYVVLRSGFPLDKAKQEAIAGQKRAHVPLAVMDGKHALKVVREHAASWGIDPQRIGMLGLSAGGIIAVSAALEPGAKENRPAFVASIYSPFWLDLTVPEDAPPLFLALANDDPNIADGNMPLYSAWKAAGRSVEVHIYAKGGHGFGMRKQGLPCDQWPERVSEWLRAESLLS